MTTIPHAISRRACERIGVQHLAVPPKAQAIALVSGLRVEPIHYIEVGRTNPHRARGKGTDPLEQLIVGDHLEALDWHVANAGARGAFPDQGRHREMVW